MSRFTDSICTVYTGVKPKPDVNSDAQIVQLPCWLLSFAWKPIRTSIWIYSSNFGCASILSRCSCPLEGRGRSDCSGMQGSRKWPGPGQRLLLES